MRSQAKLVIIGAGIVGCSAAYHLAQKGWRDIVVVDQGPIFKTGGSTSHAPGLVFQTNASRMMCELAQYSVQLYNELKLDDQPCFYPVGGLEVAYTEARLQDLKRKMGLARSWGVREPQLLTPEETAERFPLVDKNVIHGAFYVPNDGIAKALRAVEAMGHHAMEVGVEFAPRTTVTDIETRNGRVQAVVTDNGRIECEQVLLCAGMWGPRIGRMVGQPVPLAPMQHQYVITEPLPELAGETREVVYPLLREQDHSMYYRQVGDRIGIGSYHHEPLPIDPDDILSPDEAPDMPSLMAFTPEHFEDAWQAATEIIPALRGIKGFTYKINGLFSFTPDGNPLLGESLDVEGFWVAEAVWITQGAGVGKVMAEWLADGEPSMDLHEADLHRFHPHVNTREYYRARGAQQYREVYDIIHPLQQMEYPRNLRLSPAHARLEAQEGIFFEAAGWERPQWFGANRPLLERYRVPERSGWAARYWSPIEGAEHLATRDSVALYDLTPFTKIEVSGPGALGYLQYLAANNIDRPVGKVIYTSLLTPSGGIKSDLTVTRLAEDRFLVLTGAGVGMHDLAWLRQHLPADGSVHLADISSAYCTFGLWGPRARDVLQPLCEEDISNEAFRYYTARSLRIGTVPAFALRVSYVGELGWEIYTPPEYGLRLWDQLWEAGQTHGIIAAGGGAFDSLRLEKGYRLWGNDIHTEYNPYEAGLGWAVRLNKGDFIGRDALLQIKEEGISRQLCCITLDESDAVVMGNEPILNGDEVIGYISSANYGYSVGKFICYGYLPLTHSTEGTKVEVEYFGRRYPATIQTEPLFDPAQQRLKQ